MFCIENNNPTSTEQLGASCICPEADLSATTDGRCMEEKTLCKTHNSPLILATFFFIAKTAWCGWRRAGSLSNGASSDKLCLRVVSLLVII